MPFRRSSEWIIGHFGVAALVELKHCLHTVYLSVELATAQRTRPRAVVGAPRRAVWQLKSALRRSVSAAPRTIIFYIFFPIIASDFLVMNSNG